MLTEHEIQVIAQFAANRWCAVQLTLHILSLKVEGGQG